MQTKGRVELCLQPTCTISDWFRMGSVMVAPFSLSRRVALEEVARRREWFGPRKRNDQLGIGDNDVKRCRKTDSVQVCGICSHCLEDVNKTDQVEVTGRPDRPGDGWMDGWMDRHDGRGCAGKT